MKKNLFFFLLLFFFLFTAARAQSQQETIQKAGTFKNSSGTRVLSIENIHGFVQVEAHNSDQVELIAEKKINAKTQDGVARGMREVEVIFIQSGDSIYVYLEAPFIFRKQNRGRHLVINLEEINYTYQVDFTLRVPANINLLVSTVNQGEVRVNNISGYIKARNVNGPIKLTGVAGKADASTVNGRIDVYFKQNPTAESRFKTVNGNVNVYYAPKLNANLAFKTLHGQFYTDLPEVKMMPAEVEKNKGREGEGTVYKINKSNTYKLGNGGPALTFETLNGNIYLKKN